MVNDPCECRARFSNVYTLSLAHIRRCLGVTSSSCILLMFLLNTHQQHCSHCSRHCFLHCSHCLQLITNSFCHPSLPPITETDGARGWLRSAKSLCDLCFARTTRHVLFTEWKGVACISQLWFQSLPTSIQEWKGRNGVNLPSIAAIICSQKHW